MAFTENLDVFFNNSDFADTVTTGSRTFQAIFDEAFFNPEAGETSLDGTLPRLTCKMIDAETLTKKTQLTVKGRKFTVIDVQPDGTGTAVVTLSNQS